VALSSLPSALVTCGGKNTNIVEDITRTIMTRKTAGDESSVLHESLISSPRSFDKEEDEAPVVYQAENLVNNAVPVLSPPTGPTSTTTASSGGDEDDDITPGVSVVTTEDDDVGAGRGTRTTAKSVPPVTVAAAAVDEDEESRRRRRRSYSQQLAFVLACLATIVVVGFLIAAVRIVGDLWDVRADDDNSTPFLIISVACYMLLLIYGVIGTWRAYRRGNHDDDNGRAHDNYRLVEIWSMFMMCSVLGFLLLGPVGALWGAAVATFLCRP
jgi:hypothetical protein